MLTFIKPRQMVQDPSFVSRKKSIKSSLNISTIDFQIENLIKEIYNLSFCYTVQSCYGHIIRGVPNLHTLERIEITGKLPKIATYQVAYIAIVIENSNSGNKLFNNLLNIPFIDQKFIHFGSAEWFWDDQGFNNSYVIQVIPSESKYLDHFNMNQESAIQWVSARTKFFQELERLFEKASH